MNTTDEDLVAFVKNILGTCVDRCCRWY